jgi:hypothetical protein
MIVVEKRLCDNPENAAAKWMDKHIAFLNCDEANNNDAPYATLFGH